MKVLVIGANGKTATRIVSLIKKETAHEPLAMIRNSTQRAKFDDLGVATILADIEYPIDHAIMGCDAIIFAAGSGGHTGKDKTVLVDHIGAIRSMVTAQVHGVKRYLMLSAVNAVEDSNSSIAHYHKAKAFADRHLMETNLDWTIVCPGNLRDEEGDGSISVISKIILSCPTTRDNLATTPVSCLELPNTIAELFSLIEGKTPIKEVLSNV